MSDSIPRNSQMGNSVQGEAPGLYMDAMLARANHILGLLDREAFSRTRGCLDRTYWAWKFTDFPGARFQEGLCVLSYLYAVGVPDNPFYRQPRLLEWIEAGFDFWVGIQRRSGDFDEAYPYERSLAATAFSSHYLSEAWRLIEDDMDPAVSARFKDALARAGYWLTQNDETHGFLSNHLAAAGTALYHAYEICGDDRFLKRSEHFIGKILDHQSAEGWYDEYGGADPGYQTHGSYYLARYWELSGRDDLRESLDRSFKFLAHFIHPDGSLGGEYTSRNTQTYYPAAFEMMAPVSGSAAWIAQHQLPAVHKLTAAGLGSVDAYNLFPLINNYVFAHRAVTRDDRQTSDIEAPSSARRIHFPEAGLLKEQRRGYIAYVGLDKGGVVKAFDKKTGALIYNDSGYIGQLRNGKWLSSQWIDKERPVELDENAVKVSGQFFQIKKMVMKPTTFLGFRLFSLTAGRIRFLSYWLKSVLVKVLIYKKRTLDLGIERSIAFADDGFVVTDQLRGSIGDQIDRLEWRDIFTTIHMGSSRYFVPNDMTVSAAEPANDAARRVEVSALKEGVTITRTISSSTD